MFAPPARRPAEHRPARRISATFFINQRIVLLPIGTKRQLKKAAKLRGISQTDIILGAAGRSPPRPTGRGDRRATGAARLLVLYGQPRQLAEVQDPDHLRIALNDVLTLEVTRPAAPPGLIFSCEASGL
jgi:hypothetical protein